MGRMMTVMNYFQHIIPEKRTSLVSLHFADDFLKFSFYHVTLNNYEADFDSVTLV